MKPSHLDYLQQIEEQAERSQRDELYLWPRTPMGHDHQDKIRERVGVTDYEVDNNASRPGMIIAQLRRLLQRGLLTDDFSTLDIACGDAIVLSQVKKAFPGSCCYGLDCNKNQFGTHRDVQQEGVLLYNGYIQHLFAADPPEIFDVVIMLNTYRGWESADLREQERNLPELADRWFAKNARFIFLTATLLQTDNLRSLGFHQVKLGKGEDDSTMICISKSKLPFSLLQKLGI